jgi:small-conductance mechanosensitive channel
MRPSLALVCATALALARPAAPQDPPTPQDTPPTAASIQSNLDATAKDETIGAELKAALTDVLGKALEAATAAEGLVATAEGLPSREQIADELARHRRAFEDAASPALPDGGGATLEAAELALTQAQHEQTAAQTKFADLDTEASRRTARRAEIPRRLVEVRRALEDLPAQVAAESVDARLLAARRLRLRAERHRFETEATVLQAELQSYEAREQLLSVRRDLAARENNNARAVADAWQRIVQDKRAAAAAATQAAAQQAAEAARDQHPLIQELAADNETIAANLTPLADKQQAVERRIQRAAGLLAQIQAQFQDIKQRASGAGSTQTLGRTLRESRAKLPDVNRIFRRDGEQDETAEADAYLKSLDWEQERRQLADDPA